MLKTQSLDTQIKYGSEGGSDAGLEHFETVDAALLGSPVDGGEDTLTSEQVAKVVAGISTIGEARNALEEAGWRATIAGNRITVEKGVFAQFIAASSGSSGSGDDRWMVYMVAGTPPVWIVGATAKL